MVQHPTVSPGWRSPRRNSRRPFRSLMMSMRNDVSARKFGISSGVFPVRRLFIPPDGFYPLSRAVLQFKVFFQVPARRLLAEEPQQPQTVHFPPREASDELGPRADADQFVYFLKEVGGQDDLCPATAHNASNSQCGTKLLPAACPWWR